MVSLVKVTPAAMPKRAIRHGVNVVPMGARHTAAGCVDGAACTGPGCNVHTGKTSRKSPSARVQGDLNTWPQA